MYSSYDGAIVECESARALFDLVAQRVKSTVATLESSGQQYRSINIIINSLSSVVYRFGAAAAQSLVQQLLALRVSANVSSSQAASTAPSIENDKDDDEDLDDNVDGDEDSAKTSNVAASSGNACVSVLATVHGDAHLARELEQLKLNAHAIIRLRDVHRLRQLIGDEHEEDLESIERELKRQEREKLARLAQRATASKQSLGTASTAEEEQLSAIRFDAQLLCNIFSMRLRSKLLFHKEYYRSEGTGQLVYVRNPFQNEMLMQSIQKIQQASSSSSSSASKQKSKSAGPVAATKAKPSGPVAPAQPLDRKQREAQALDSEREATIALKALAAASLQKVAPSTSKKGMIIVDSDEEFGDEDEDPDEDLEV